MRSSPMAMWPTSPPTSRSTRSKTWPTATTAALSNCRSRTIGLIGHRCLVIGHSSAMRLVILLAISALLVPGCSTGPAKGEVQGKITFKGQPVKEGTVTFLNTKEGGAAEAQIKDGTYVIQGG